MDKKITFGFIPVNNTPFRGNQMKNASLLFNGDHVREVCEWQMREEKFSKIAAKVIPQMNINNVPYSVEIQVN